MAKSTVINFRLPEEDRVQIERLATHRNVGVSTLAREWMVLLARADRNGFWDSLDYLAEKMGKTHEAVLVGIINARAAELLGKDA